ncbi:MAG: FHA domain-containing protein, partial [Planctomycetota bacterium]
KRPAVRDHGSTNGTRANGIRVSERYLFHGDVLELAGSEIQFREPGRPAPVAGGKHPSLILRESGTEKSIRYRLVSYCLIGRDEACTVPLRDTESSGEHAEVMEKNRGFVVRDLHSTNGTKVNGTRITAETPLKHGDAVTIGTTTLYFKESEKPLPTPKAGVSVPMIAGIAVIALVLVGGAMLLVFQEQLFPKDGSGTNGSSGTVTQENLIVNGSFESLGEGWILPAGEAEVVEEMAKDGKKCLLLAGPSRLTTDVGKDVVVHSELRETVTAAFYNVSGFVHTENSKGYAGIRLQWTDGNTPIPGIPSSFTQLITGTTDDWMHVGGTFRTPPRPPGVASMVLKLSLIAAGASGRTCFDDIRLTRMNQPDVDLRDRPVLQTGSDYYTLRAADSGIFTMDQYGQPFLRNGHIILERRDGDRGATQFVASVDQGPSKSGTMSYRLDARIMDFHSGEEARFEQNMAITEEDEIKITYFVTAVPSGGGYTPVLLMELLPPPTKFSLFDKDNKAWEFENDIDWKRDVSEVSWRVSNNIVVLSVDPPSNVETRRISGGGMFLRILPPLGSGSRLILTFGTKSRAGEFAADQDFEAFERAVNTGHLGRAIRIGQEYLEKHKDMNVRRQSIKTQVEQLKRKAKSDNEVASEKWKSFQNSADALEMDARKTQVQEFITKFQSLADAYDGSEFAEKPKKHLKEARKMQKEMLTADLSEMANKYLRPARKAVDEGERLRARIYLESLKAQAGLFENLTPELREAYDKLCRLAAVGAELGPEALYEEALNLKRQNKVEEAIKVLKKIIALHLDNPEDATKYSSIALKAYKLLKELR